jgi:F-type H+-transporting ATPase subunit a
MELSPDQTIFWTYSFVTINLTVLTTWALMLAMTVGSWLITRNLRTDINISRWQSALEIIVTGIRDQIEEIGLKDPGRFIPFVGTMFLFIATANLCIVIPGYEPPTGSLSTTAALALCVFLAVPFYGITETGLVAFLKTYLQPTVLMLPFNIIGEVSRTIALAVRLFGNIMSGGMIIAILLSISPLVFPVMMEILGLITGLVQAYIFSILATVYVAAAAQEAET